MNLSRYRIYFIAKVNTKILLQCIVMEVGSLLAGHQPEVLCSLLSSHVPEVKGGEERNVDTKI